LTVEIRHATKDDLERLVDVFRNQDLKTSREESQWFISCYFEYHHIVVAEVDGRVQGACVWRIEGERYSGLGWIENIWVEEKSRRVGLAERLLRRSIDDMRIYFDQFDIKLRKVVLTTQVERNSARKLYEKIGFRVVARLDELYDPGGHDLIYVLDVKS
jgi:ribosomal protein S18 acetylase RimI-like enzyme